jgi:Flp pilus assembly protein TadG
MIRLTCPSLARLHALAPDTRGAMAIETAIVAPVLVLLSIGSFQVSQMVARQNELQSGAEQAEAIALAANSGASTDTSEVKSLLMSQLSLSSDQVDVTKRFRCNADTTLSDTNTCSSDDEVSTYLSIKLTDTYQPIWSKIGVGGSVTYHVNRMVLLT